MQRPSVLIVDDDPAIHTMLVDVLEDEGYRALSAYDGREALELLQAEPADLVLLDLMMPVMDGWQFRQAMSGIAGLRHVPVLILSASADGAGHARDLGAQGFIPKPFDLNTLLDELAKRLALSGVDE